MAVAKYAIPGQQATAAAIEKGVMKSILQCSIRLGSASPRAQPSLSRARFSVSAGRRAAHVESRIAAVVGGDRVCANGEARSP